MSMFDNPDSSILENYKFDEFMGAAKNRRMPFAFHLHALRQHWRNPVPSQAELHAACARIGRAGFDGLDVSDSWPFEALTADAATAVRTIAAEHGLQIPLISCMGKTLCHPALGARNLQALQAALDVAERLGAQTVNIALSVPRTPGVTPVMGAPHSPGGSLHATPDDFALTAERLRLLAAQAAARGLSLAIELHDRSIADTSTALLQLLERIDAPNVGANPDLCNGYRAYETPPETWQAALAALAPRMNLWHVNNLQRIHFAELRRAAFVECSLADGDVDYSLALREVQASGFDGWVVIEYKGQGDAFATTAAGRRYLAALQADATAAAASATA
jgi:sugar phosphate isomerase/epimerase